MKLSSKLIALLLVLVMATAAMAGCSQTTASSNASSVSQNVQSTDSSNTASTDEQKEVLEVEVYLNYSWWVVDTPFDGSDEISKWIMDNKRIKLNFTNPGGDEAEKMNIMIATDTFPDTIMMERDANAKKLVELGKIVKLDDYIEKYPGYKSVVSEETRKISSYNGGVYNLLNWPLNSGWMGMPRMFYLNQQMYNDLGKPDITGIEGFYNYLKAIKDADLKVNGQSVVPLQSDSSKSPASTLMLCFDGGLAGYEEVDGRLQYQFRKPGTLDAIKFLNKLYNEGLINKDCFAEQQDQVKEKVLNGRVGVYLTDGSLVDEAIAAYRSGETDFTYDAFWKWPAPAGKKPSDLYAGSYNNLGWNALYITSSAKEPERIYEFFDWLITPEGQNVVAFGPQGLLWDNVDEKGVPILNEGKSLDLTADELKRLPLYKFQFLGNATYYDYAKLKMNASAPDDKKNQMMQWQFEALNDPGVSKKKDVTSWTGTSLGQDDPEYALDQDITNYILDQYTKMLTEPNAENVEKLYNETLKIMDDKGAKQVEDRWNAIWQQNKAAFGI